MGFSGLENGWTEIFHKRVDGTESFYQPWKSYRSGFGNVAGEYWLGLENIFLLTIRKKNELRVDMEDWEGGKAFAQYSSFSISPEYLNYQLHLGSFTGGDAGDSLTHHNSTKFTTFDKDLDMSGNNCARHYFGGFWYNACHWANPTGIYAPHGTNGTSTTNSIHIAWKTWKGYKNSIKTIEMKIRSVKKCSCTQ
ncbi:microfibril-associated glycoprotein 4-like isoform X2 [Betta splendens]|uniref:Microfibril-associated glycoprotein 4-like isoform X2 n=1 Tax=Betta splendens TaxID=158456 RepID=A0A9W2XTV0_BETSP|nr:microfibril-associated glycoprotein 4-like isoform X2 [Betta splendens]